MCANVFRGIPFHMYKLYNERHLFARDQRGNSRLSARENLPSARESSCISVRNARFWRLRHRNPMLERNNVYTAYYMYTSRWLQHVRDSLVQQALYFLRKFARIRHLSSPSGMCRVTRSARFRETHNTISGTWNWPPRTRESACLKGGTEYFTFKTCVWRCTAAAAPRRPAHVRIVPRTSSGAWQKNLYVHCFLFKLAEPERCSANIC